MRLPSSAFAAFALFAAPAFAAAAPLPRSQMTYYGEWDAARIPTLQRFGIVTLQPGMYTPEEGEAAAIATLRSKGTLVLLYVTLGEDDRTYDNKPPVAGDGRGPVHWDLARNAPVYANKGIASFYLDEWNAQGADSDTSNKVPDGLPDRQGDWGSCLVNAGDPLWQNEVMAAVKDRMDLGADGLFLDTPETPDPWHGYGWTAEGMYTLIKKIRDAYPSKFLLLNRGLFFFEPNYPHQYRFSPRKLVNAVLFESYYTDSNYPVEQGGNGIVQVNPFFELNKYTTAPRLNAEFGRKDSYGSVLHLDYAAAPMSLPQSDPALYQRILQESAVEQGWLPLVTDRLVGSLPVTALDAPAPADRAPPKWQNTAVGFSDLILPPPPFFMAPGYDKERAEFQRNPPAPRTGLQKALPGNGQVTLRWDVAADQTRPVRYNVYYSQDALLDFGSSPRLPDVKAGESADYTVRGHLDADDACPYEFTVTGLANNRLYRFAVRAEDGTSGVTPSAGRGGPGGGVEETNAQVLMAIPRDSTAFPIVIDGDFADWAAVPAFPDSAGDGAAAGVDFRLLRVTDDRDNLYLALDLGATADPARVSVLLNADSRSFTGDTAAAGSGFRGADYKWEAGAIFRFEAADPGEPGTWVRTTVAASHRASGNRLEIRLPKVGTGGDQAMGLNLLAKAVGGAETLPDQGAIGIAYAYIRPLAQSGIVDPGRIRGARGQAITWQAAAGGGRIGFRNPRGSAELVVHDARGHCLAWFSRLPGTSVPLAPGRTSGILLVTVRARGLAPFTTMIVP